MNKERIYSSKSHPIIWDSVEDFKRMLEAERTGRKIETFINHLGYREVRFID